VKGYDIQLEDPLLHTQILSLVDGGTLSGTPGEAGESYSAPGVCAAAARTAFDLYAYSADRDQDGEAIAYHEWLFPACKGSPSNPRSKTANSPPSATASNPARGADSRR
jgi:hypothetical protein